MTHELKCWPQFFRAIKSGEKRFELRRDDRDQPFRCGDKLRLREWNPNALAPGFGDYTGRALLVHVTYVMAGPAFGVAPGFVCMSIRKARPTTRRPG